MRKLLFIPLAASCLFEITACRKHSSALPPPNDTSGKDSVNIIDTPTETNSAYDSATMYFTKAIDVYKNSLGFDSIRRAFNCGVYIGVLDYSLIIRVNGVKLSLSPSYQWWQYGTYIDSSSTPGYPIYDSARIQFIAPNGFKDLDYRMPYMPFHPETVPYVVSKNGFNIPIIANDLAGADSVHVNVTGGYFDTTFKITDCNVYVDSARLHHMYSSFPADGLINIHAFKWFNVISHGKKYSILNTSTASYHVMVQ